MKFKALIIFLGLLPLSFFGQEITPREKDQVLSTLMQKIKEIYPFPDISEKTISCLQTRISNDYYADCVTKNEFASKVSLSLEEISNDKHLELNYNPSLAKSILEEPQSNGAEYTAQEAEAEAWNNYGFKQLSVLEGNIGYLNLSVFFATDYAGKTADVAMNYFANCKALIIDLRQNGGGWDDMVNYLLGYFIDINEPLLRDISLSTIDSTYYSAVIPNYVPGKKMTTFPIYVLTSGSTASAAESFVSNLKFFNKNVTLVGEKTAGAENPVSHIALNEDFILQIPSWKKVYSANPNVWEGVGIDPDIKCDIEKAKETAHLNALEKLMAACNERFVMDKYQWAIDGLKAGYENVDTKNLKKYSGNYDNIRIKFSDGKLYYQKNDRPQMLMVPVNDHYFIVEGTEYFRIKFLTEGNNTVLKQIFSFGMEREYVKGEGE